MSWQPDPSGEYEYNDTDRPPLLRGRFCPKCGGNELFVVYQPPHWLARLFGAREYLEIICCDCGYPERVRPWGQT